ncbi:Myeloid-associated differentiation marker-like protein 2 [Merluccius polli]|uniref:Myeloid-associated differentiation marker-like protein 2 n=1 Tax=Merluccius polli TaxID=89951 RepID=A0AA47M449_MERPO|nr:Myeloid-associated differentiation marker-like protein 2 [Merluccius polli]
MLGQWRPTNQIKLPFLSLTSRQTELLLLRQSCSRSDRKHLIAYTSSYRNLIDEVMCGPFKSFHSILRLLEMIFSGVALILAMFQGGMARPWSIWCDFVWFFCILTPLVIVVVEALKLDLLLVVFLPHWADLVCGLTMICTLMISSASGVYGASYTCFNCVLGIICLTFSVLATAAFLLDAILLKLKCPSGYLSHLRGMLRFTEAFVACLLLTAATSYFLYGNWLRPPGMMWGLLVFAVCLLANVAVILFNLVKPLSALLPMGRLECVYNIVATLLYLSAAILWLVYGYWWYFDHTANSQQYCNSCWLGDLHLVTAGVLLNLLLYIVDVLHVFLEPLEAEVVGVAEDSRCVGIRTYNLQLERGKGVGTTAPHLLPELVVEALVGAEVDPLLGAERRERGPHDGARHHLRPHQDYLHTLVSGEGAVQLVVVRQTGPHGLCLPSPHQVDGERLGVGVQAKDPHPPDHAHRSGEELTGDPPGRLLQVLVVGPGSARMGPDVVHGGAGEEGLQAEGEVSLHGQPVLPPLHLPLGPGPRLSSGEREVS